jgi:predicted secreted hydrolase
VISRRHLLCSALALAGAPGRAAVEYPAVTPRTLEFPRDHGAHPDYRIEWWYLTGWLDAPGMASIGYQMTFFRTRTDIDPANPSGFSAKQLMIAHAAIADPARGALMHEERLVRAGFGAASAATEDTDVHLARWRFWRLADGSYRCTLPARSFTLEFDARPTQPLLLQGTAGFSRKGPDPSQASYYYSQPQLEVRARLTRDGRTEQRSGHGWLDHEWSSAVLAPEAAGWDWVGMNFDDGSALTAFEIRPRAAGDAAIHAYAALRPRGEPLRTYGPDEVRFTPIDAWTSPRTHARWPVGQQLRVGDRTFRTQPLMNDQELDSRRTSGTVYWEGASRLFESDRPVGRGYLEMTGYVAPIRL